MNEVKINLLVLISHICKHLEHPNVSQLFSRIQTVCKLVQKMCGKLLRKSNKILQNFFNYKNSAVVHIVFEGNEILEFQLISGMSSS